MSVIIDTNVLLDYPQILKETKDTIIILTDVLRELDKLKISSNNDVAFKARRAAAIIYNNFNDITFNNFFENNKDLSVDDKLIAAALQTCSILISNDVYLLIKAKIAEIPTQTYRGKEDYTGVQYFTLSSDKQYYSEELEKVLNGEDQSIKKNQFIIIKDSQTDQHLGIYKKSNNQISIIYPNIIIKNKYVGEISPKNPEQICLFDALLNPNITILYAGGQYGTGKSFLLNNYALQELEKGKIKKIVYIPNNSYTENTINLGALPGELLDKTIGQIGPLVDLIGIDEITKLLTTESLEIVPMSNVRGRSFQDSIIIVNEAQNLTEKHIKLLIGRCGEGTRIFFDGDYKQTDSIVFKNKNGLRLLLNLADSDEYSSIFATVKLTKVERSKTAQAADYLDSLNNNI